MHRSRFALIVGIALLAPAAAPALGADWPQFRGPDMNGLDPVGGFPGEWGESHNVSWSVEVPGNGWSAPIVTGNHVFLTTAVPEGGDGQSAVHRFEVHCYDVATGEQLWKRVAMRRKPRLPTHRDNTYASETPVTDGERVYAYFGMHGLFCYDLRGELIWQKDLGNYPMANGWGTSSGPVLIDGLLFVPMDNEEESHLVALDTANGQERWRADRSDERSNWGTPVVWRNSERTELVLCGKTVRSYAPKSGEVLWSMEIGGRCSASPAAYGDVLYVGSENRAANGGTPGGLFAVKAGATGDIDVTAASATDNGLLWANTEGAIGMASPLVVDGWLYVLERRGGVMRVHNAATGELAYRKRLPGGAPFWASPWSYGGLVYCLDEDGVTFVLTPSGEYTLVRQNKLPGRFWSCPAMADGSVLLRSTDRLYCVRNEGQG